MCGFKSYCVHYIEKDLYMLIAYHYGGVAQRKGTCFACRRLGVRLPSLPLMVQIDTYRIKMGNTVHLIKVICDMCCKVPDGWNWASGIKIDKLQAWVEKKGGSIKKVKSVIRS